MWALLSNSRAANRFAKRPTGYRYSQLERDLSFVTATVGGAKVHGILHETLKIFPTALHSIHAGLSEIDAITAPGIAMSRFEEARRFYDSIGYTSHFYFSSNDATALRPTLTIGKGDRLVGLCTLKAVAAGETLQAMMEAAHKFGIATRVDLLLLNPVDTRYPSFPFAVFPQRSSPAHSVLVERWNVMHNLLAERGMCVLAHGSDGDAPQLKAMLARATTTDLPHDFVIFSFTHVPCIITGGTKTISAPARRMHAIVQGTALPGLITCPVLAFQDPVHLGLKLRGRILTRDARGARLGNGVASLGQLIEMIGSTANAFCENDLGIQRSDPCPRDRMNFPAFERLCNDKLLRALDVAPNRARPPPPTQRFTSATPMQPSRPLTRIDVLRNCIRHKLALHESQLDGLKKVELAAVLGIQLRQRDRAKALKEQILAACPRALSPPSTATATPASTPAAHVACLPQPAPRDTRHLAAYLRFARASVFAFLGDFQPEERLFLAWYARYFADGWRAWLDHNGVSSSSDDFISTNQYACITINSESLLLYYHWLCSHDALRRNVSACPVGAGSQQNENQFRSTRATSNDPNFTLGEFMRRLAIAQAQEIIKAKRAGLFHFPKHHKHVYSDHIRRNPQLLPANFSEHRARELLAAAMSAARADLAALGVVLPSSQQSPAAAAAAASPVVLTTTDLHDDLDAAPRQASFIEDAEFEAFPEGFLDPDSDDSDYSDVSDSYSQEDLSEDEQNSDNTSNSTPLGVPFTLTDAIIDAHFADAIRPPVSNLSRSVIDEATGDFINKSKAAAQVSGRAKTSSDRCVKYQKRVKR